MIYCNYIFCFKMVIAFISESWLNLIEGFIIKMKIDKLHLVVCSTCIYFPRVNCRSLIVVLHPLQAFLDCLLSKPANEQLEKLILHLQDSVIITIIEIINIQITGFFFPSFAFKLVYVLWSIFQYRRCIKAFSRKHCTVFLISFFRSWN